jgi:hypothetical protein
MAVYNRADIESLCKRMEARSNSVLNVQPSAAADMRAAALLLKLMLTLGDIQVVETEGERSALNVGRRLS